ncbi:MAG: hypothetical protein Q9167_001422 [Letrouitia subvulpina]
MNYSKPFEEERLPWYRADQFYPVHIGEIFISKYRVVVSGFVALKLCTRSETGSPRNDRELKFYEYVSSLNSQHSGQAYIRGLLETFEINGPTGKHLCLVQPPMHVTIRELQRQNASKRLNKQILNWTLFNLLSALSFLHDEAKVIHTGGFVITICLEHWIDRFKTDINPSNIMLSIDDKSLLSEFEQAEVEEPSPTKVIDETRTIYGSRKLGLPKNSLWGQPVLCDFGEARIDQAHKGLIQPELYRAPGVLFNMEWNCSVDVWNIAVLDLFEGQHLFHTLNEAQDVSATHHVAEMVGYLGTPPLEYLRRSEVTNNVFDEQGHWKGSGGVDVPDMSFERAEIVLEGEEKRQFLIFVRSILRWLPEERRRAVELLTDPWLEGAIP